MKNSIHTPRAEVTTATGQVDLLAPKSEHIDVSEMAASLARKGRYTDLSNRRVTVAQHLMLTEYLAFKDGVTAPAARLHVLLHDAHEAYMGDISRPLKLLLDAASDGMISRIERGLDEAIFGRFGVPRNAIDHGALKVYDNLSLAYEVAWCFPNAAATWAGLPEIDIETHEDFIGPLLACGESAIFHLYVGHLSKLQDELFGQTHRVAEATVN
jgi:hypothetical protein